MKNSILNYRLWQLLVMMIIVLSGCQTDSPERAETNVKQEYQIAVDELLDRNTKELTSDDAIIVASLFSKSEMETRSGTSSQVRSVVPIEDKEGNIAMYAVNYEKGYILVSATTAYYPILATIDNGNYNRKNNEIGQSLIIEELIENIKAAKSGEISFPVKHLWNKYIKDDALSKEDVLTRSQSDDYWEAYNKWYADMCKNGVPTITLLTRGPGGLPDDIYKEFVAIASSEDLWEGTQYDWKNTAYVVEHTSYSNNNTEAMLKTQWSQDSEFNSNVNPLGCVTVAVGQLMRFYQYPSNFAWSQMPNTYGNDVLRSFLATLRSELKVSKNGGASIGDAERVLKSYGYSVDQISHSADRIYSSIRNGKPVYARGEDELSGQGHAWVIDGIHQSTTKVEYRLYILSDAWYPEFKYVSADGCYYSAESDVITYHMNWGWHGTHDGYYIDQRPWIVDNSAFKYKFSKDRKELIFK